MHAALELGHQRAFQKGRQPSVLYACPRGGYRSVEVSETDPGNILAQREGWALEDGANHITCVPIDDRKPARRRFEGRRIGAALVDKIPLDERHVVDDASGRLHPGIVLGRDLVGGTAGDGNPRQAVGSRLERAVRER